MPAVWRAVATASVSVFCRRLTWYVPIAIVSSCVDHAYITREMKTIVIMDIKPIQNVIRNDRQFRMVRAAAERLQRAVAELPQHTRGLDSRLADAVDRSYRRKLADITRQLRDYEALKGGSVRSVPLRDLGSVGEVLIAARVAKNWTQADLAEALGVHAQQIQRYEALGYATASLERLAEIADALGVRVEGSVALSRPARAAARATRKTRTPRPSVGVGVAG